MDKMYFALAPNKFDISVVLEARPKNLLLSYGLWGKQKGKYKLSKIVNEFWDNGYYPNIMLDSGAYTFRNDSQESSFLSLINHYVLDLYYNDDEFKTYDECLIYYINLINNNELDLYYTDQNKEKLLRDYPNLLFFLEFIEINKNFINEIISLDDINSEINSKDNWKIIKTFFNEAIPTFHYGENEEVLDYYVKNGAKCVGLGGIPVAKKNGIKFKDIINWVNKCSLKYRDVDFHLFGCQDSRILNKVTIHSADGASWIISSSKQYNQCNKSKFDLAYEIIKNKEI